LLLVAAVCCAPSPAAAACGDYVTIRPADGEPGDHTDAGRPLDPTPCHGPNCSGSPARDPFAPVVPPVTHGSVKDGVTPAGNTPNPASRRSCFPIPASDVCPPGTAAAIFHPPRPG
jgi:hypothetical protein